MDPEQYQYGLWLKANKEADRLEYSIKKKGPVFKDFTAQEVEPDEFKCVRCGGLMFFGIYACDGQKMDQYGVTRPCGKCAEGKPHYTYKCRICAGLYEAEDVWKRKTHFFMSGTKPKGKINA